MSKALLFPFSVLIAMAAALSACGQRPQSQNPPPPAEVGIVTLKAEPVALVRELPGRTHASLIAEVRPQVSGIVKELLFEEGSRVLAGQPLYQIDDALYRAELNTATAALAKAQATMVAARQRAQRSAELVKTNVISTQDNEANAAALGEAEAEVASAQAAVASAKVKSGYARIVAPISGRTGRSSVTQGALVTENQSAPLATIQRLDPIYIELTQSSSEWLQLQRELTAGKLNQDNRLPVRILLEDGTTYAHSGELRFADVSVDPTTGSYAMRVQAPNPENLLLPGMYVRALLDLGVRPEGVLAPQQGITRDAKGNATAMVVNAASKVEARSVRVQHTVGDKWVVEEGLEAGDRLIVSGLQKIAPGAAVVPIELTASTSSPTAGAASSR